ncbi:MAG: DUF4126 domain-containing protein [Bryobacteraceae bacterium]
MPDWISTLGVAMGSAWVSGINLYAAIAMLGLLEHFGLAHLPGDLGFVGKWWVILLACGLYLAEFVADKVPAVDSIWDAVHTFIRVPAGAVLASAAFAHFDPGVRIAALLLGGGVALGSHGTKAAVRIGANLSPEPLSNVVLSLVEDLVVIGSSLVIASHPVVMIAVVLVFLCVIAWLFRKIVRTLRGYLKGAFRKCYT